MTYKLLRSQTMLRYIDRPPIIERTAYQELINEIVAILSRYSCVKAVYQTGSIKNPGISDLDILCVLANDTELDLNIHNELPVAARKILTHGLFGLFEDDIPTVFRYSFISSLRFLHGTDSLSLDEKVAMPLELKRQLALEYLLKMFLTLDIQLKYQVLKLRSFLLEAKALIFDLELLGVQEGKLHQLVQEVIALRDSWYNDPPAAADLERIARGVHSALEELLSGLLQEQPIYLPKTEIQIAKNTTLKAGSIFQTRHVGLFLPPFLSFLERRYFSLQARISSHEYRCPAQLPPEHSAIGQRFTELAVMVQKHRRKAPFFGAFTSSLRLF